MSGSAYRAEWLAEMANEAETKKEAEEYWREYRHEMISVTGDKDLFRKPKCYTNKPSKALIRTVNKCSCGRNRFIWSRKEFGWPKCVCGSMQGQCCDDDGYMNIQCSCGKVNGKHRVGTWVKMSCECGKETDWHLKNSLARDEWNKINA